MFDTVDVALAPIDVHFTALLPSLGLRVLPHAQNHYTARANLLWTSTQLSNGRTRPAVPVKEDLASSRLSQ